MVTTGYNSHVNLFCFLALKRQVIGKAMKDNTSKEIREKYGKKYSK